MAWAARAAPIGAVAPCAEAGTLTAEALATACAVPTNEAADADGGGGGGGGDGSKYITASDARRHDFSPIRLLVVLQFLFPLYVTLL